MNMTRNLLAALLLFGLLSCGGTERETHPSRQPGMCAKEEMAADGIVRLSKIGLRQTHRFRTFPEIQTGDAAHGQIIGAD